MQRIVPAVALAAAVITAAAGCSSTSSADASRHRPTHSPTVSPTTSPTHRPSGSCHASSLDPASTRPDPACTPGALNPNVTQANIHQTVCVAGYTKTIRPPVAYTNALKRQQIIEYGYANTSPSAYEEDHFIPLSLGGNPTDPHNLWPEPGNPNPKDQVEFKLYKALCAGQVQLAPAQQAIAADWTTAVAKLGLK
ncbi:HNH endonuclease signature motif containing protein [Actinomadura harenae]|uniref:HNH endonuclease n=1 Tax=Actinomadura harenae TaxID=2483351 RepID=A0A3M2MG27_9ACTN|nr:HNH endonuclease signature motif containing protein [Actinomadura harenae]RMI47595.1 HNH endonuclease [Actinomadura harenae]